MTILSADLQVWAWASSVSLTFNLPEQLFQMALLLLKENDCVKLFWNLCKKSGPGQAQLMTILYHLTFKCDLDLQPTWKKFQMALLLDRQNNLTKLFWNPCINVEIMARTTQFMTILSFDLQVWPRPSTYQKKCFKWHFYFSRITTVPNNFEIHA